MITTASNRMSAISRRKFLAGAAGLGAAALLPTQLFAATAPYSFKQGEFEVTIVSDGELVVPVDIFAPDTPAAERDAFLKANNIGKEVHSNPNLTLIKRGDELILFDTGSGTNFQPTAGKLSENLTAAGIDPAKITKVVMTHGHPDHIWGNVLDDGKLRFPNAAYYSGGTEWDFWNAKDLIDKMPKEMGPFVLGAQKNYAAVKDRVTMLKAGDEVVSGIRALDTPGHTPGHMSFEVAGGDGLIIVVDAVVRADMYFAHPDWKFGFDSIPDVAIETRKKLLDRAATDKVKMIGYHWPAPGVGFAERKGTAYSYAPAT
jgi:glyoxylase-like metal-dependent hydrolase (beta-lactamase superfamily II)